MQPPPAGNQDLPGPAHQPGEDRQRTDLEGPGGQVEARLRHAGHRQVVQRHQQSGDGQQAAAGRGELPAEMRVKAHAEDRRRGGQEDEATGEAKLLQRLPLRDHQRGAPR